MLEAARKEGTGWIKVDSELIAKLDAALDGIRTDLKKAERENSSLYFQVLEHSELGGGCIVIHAGLLSKAMHLCRGSTPYCVISCT